MLNTNPEVVPMMLFMVEAKGIIPVTSFTIGLSKTDVTVLKILPTLDWVSFF
jgi:hypothetical protein